MRINANCTTSLLTSGSTEEDPLWFQNIVKQFCEYNDVNSTHSKILEWLYSPVGIQAMVDWMKSIGYNCSYYEIVLPRLRKSTPIAFGIDISDNCEKFTELKLKS